jgi:hypothetical protein
MKEDAHILAEEAGWAAAAAMETQLPVLLWLTDSITRKHACDLERLLWLVKGYAKNHPDFLSPRMIDLDYLLELPDILFCISDHNASRS